jgi:hypothetical protein
MRRNIALLALVSLIASSCALITGNSKVPDSPSSLEVSVFQKAFMGSYYAERAGKPGGAASGMALLPMAARASGPKAMATVPVVGLTDKSFAKAVTAPQSFPNYPEPAQTTTFTASKYDENGGKPVYAISVATSFPSSDARKSYLEEYYVEDLIDIGNWTIDDPIVELSGGEWAVNPSARTKMLLTFRDGTTRTETIVSSSLTDKGRLLDPAAFDLGGSLDLDQAFLPKAAPAAPYPASGVLYSSVVMYYVTPATSYNFWFWQGSSQQTILGVRYYTEYADAGAGTYTAYTTSFEKAIGTLTTTGGSFTSTLKTVYSGSTFDTLAESVLRQRVVYGLDQKASGATTLYVPKGTGEITTNMQTRVVNIAGKKDFFLKQMDSDQVQLASWADSTIYVPEGEVDDILAASPKDNVFTRDQQIDPAEGTLPFAVEVVDSSGLGDLATLYTSITQGSASAAVANAPAGSNLTGSNVYSFNGQQAAGQLIASDAMPDLSQKGTVEAWVYLNSVTDTAGIIHKGTDVKFADECFSLQGWDNAGQVAIILDKPGSGNTYDRVASGTNLAKRKWYYLVATWDTATKKICLYVNGNLSGSGTMSNTASGVRANDSDIIVGSQLPVSYSAAYGYFGLDGKIVGASVSAIVMTAAEVTAKYNLYKGNTSSW